MAKVVVEAGVCGFVTTIEAVPQEGYQLKLTIDTPCPSLQPSAAELTAVDGRKVCFAQIGDSEIFAAARKYCRHAACPVPTAIHKAAEVACNFALPKDVRMTITKE